MESNDKTKAKVDSKQIDSWLGGGNVQTSIDVVIKETKSHGMHVWVCEMNGVEIARALSEQMLYNIISNMNKKRA